MNNLEHFFKSAMPNCGFSRMLKAMEEKLSNVVIGEFVKVEAISPEELRAYLQYITNPIDMKLESYMRGKASAKSIFGALFSTSYFAEESLSRPVHGQFR